MFSGSTVVPCSNPLSLRWAVEGLLLKTLNISVKPVVNFLCQWIKRPGIVSPLIWVQNFGQILFKLQRSFLLCVYTLKNIFKSVNTLFLVFQIKSNIYLSLPR